MNALLMPNVSGGPTKVRKDLGFQLSFQHFNRPHNTKGLTASLKEFQKGLSETVQPRWNRHGGLVPWRWHAPRHKDSVLTSRDSEAEKTGDTFHYGSTKPLAVVPKQTKYAGFRRSVHMQMERHRVVWAMHCLCQFHSCISQTFTLRHYQCLWCTRTTLFWLPQSMNN